MFEVGFTELLLIFALALVVLGPEKLPRIASQLGHWLGRARAMARQFREQLEEEAATLEAERRAPPPAAPPPDAAPDEPAPSTESAPRVDATPGPNPGDDEYSHAHHERGT